MISNLRAQNNQFSLDLCSNSGCLFASTRVSDFISSLANDWMYIGIGDNRRLSTWIRYPIPSWTIIFSLHFTNLFSCSFLPRMLCYSPFHVPSPSCATAVPSLTSKKLVFRTNTADDNRNGNVINENYTLTAKQEVHIVENPIGQHHVICWGICCHRHIYDVSHSFFMLWYTMWNAKWRRSM